MQRRVQRKATAKVVAVGIVAGGFADGAMLHRQRIIRVLRGRTGRVRLPASGKLPGGEGVFTETGRRCYLRREVS